MTAPTGKFPTTFYRVSAKAIIRNENGDVLLVKEQGSDWSLPGGGVDHGESIEDALRRELYEETLIVDDFTLHPIGVDQVYMHNKEAWLMWIIYEVNFAKQPTFGVGADADEVAFVDPYTLKHDKERTHQLIYRWTVDKSHHVDQY